MIYQSYTNSHPIHVSFLVSLEEKCRRTKTFPVPQNDHQISLLDKAIVRHNKKGFNNSFVCDKNKFLETIMRIKVSSLNKNIGPLRFIGKIFGTRGH